MLIELTLCKRAETSAIYKKPSRHPNFHQELSCINDALKEAPKLTTKNWYAWSPRLKGILSNWFVARKHLDGVIKPGDKKFDRKLDDNLLLESSEHQGPKHLASAICELYVAEAHSGIESRLLPALMAISRSCLRIQEMRRS
ncbi:uncharacterized protein UHOD_11441 [Ustilago sp. UG-2017b]|nr:uncharacterized protein UHOD_11441 [Ustilago sp. UG-2017b]